MKEVTTLNEVANSIERNPKTLIVFYADWCGPCKVYKPVYERLERNFPDINVLRVNVDNAMEISRTYGVRGVPYSIMVNDGKKKSALGVISYNQLKESFNQ